MKKSLTKEQTAFAAKNHELIYEFLNLRHLPEDEFYDIAALAFLESIPETECKDFRKIAFEKMDSAVQTAISSNATEISLYDLANAYRTYEEIIVDDNDQIEAMLNEIAVNEQMLCLEPKEKQLVTLILRGFRLNEIANHLHKTVTEMNSMYDVIVDKLKVANYAAA